MKVADRYGVRFTPRRRGAGGTPLDRPVIAAAVAADELFALREMGFDVRPVSTAVLNAGFDLSDVDVLFVSSGLSYAELNAAGQGRGRRVPRPRRRGHPGRDRRGRSTPRPGCCR